jgi:hypothetical protein
MRSLSPLTALFSSTFLIVACSLDWKDHRATKSDAGADAFDGGQEGGVTMPVVSRDAGEDAGAEPGPPCTGEADDSCDDHDPCNGVETCQDLHCTKGTPPCTNPDPDHCEVVCLPAGASVSCPTVGKDADGDGHRDPACAVDPNKGDDCNDGEKSVFAGAKELCDGLDNDCDGKVDLEDGLVVSGSVNWLDMGKQAVVSFAPPNTYGVAFVSGTDIMFTAMDKSGARLFLSKNLTNGANTNVVGDVSLFWGGDVFGLSWVRYEELLFQRMSKSGDAVDTQVKVAPMNYTAFGGYTSIARVGDGDWQSYFGCCMSRPAALGRRISGEGAVNENLYPVGPSAVFGQMASAVSGDQMATVFTVYDQSTPQGEYRALWTRRDAEMNKLETGDAVLATNGKRLDHIAIAATENGYGITWKVDHVYFAEFDRDGNKRCGPEDLSTSFSEDAFPDFAPSSMAAGPAGYAIVGAGKISATPPPAGDPTDAVDLVHVAPGCKYVQRFRIGELNDTLSDPSITSAGDAGFGVVWSVGDAAETGGVHRRILSANLCE